MSAVSCDPHVEDCPDGVCGRGVVRAHGHGGELQLGEADPLDGGGGRVLVSASKSSIRVPSESS